MSGQAKTLRRPAPAGSHNVPAHLRGRRPRPLWLTEPDELTRAQRELDRLMREKP
jgi:hypothetical protein